MIAARWLLHGVIPLSTHIDAKGTPLARVGGAKSIRRVRLGNLYAVLSQSEGRHYCHDHASITALAAQHHELLCEFSANGPLVPARFGQGFRSLSAAHHCLSCEIDVWQETLTQIGDSQELSLLIRSMPQPDSDGEGVSYLRRRASSRKAIVSSSSRLKDAAQTVAADLRPLSSQLKLNPIKRRKSLEVDITMLIPRNQITKTTEAVELLGRAFSPRGFGFFLRGPWPPYSFTA